MEPYPIANGEALKAIVALRLPLRTMASRRFGSSRPTTSNSNAATRITINTYRLANMGQWLASYKERILSGSAVLRKLCANLIDPYSVAVGLLPKHKAPC